MDTVRAVQVARSLPGADRCRTVLTGFSFSGGLAVMAAPWIPDLGYIAVGVPTFGAYDLRRTLVKGGSGAELNRLLDGLDEGAVRALRERLRYFDAVNFAARIEGVPVTVGYGVVDPSSRLRRSSRSITLSRPPTKSSSASHAPITIILCWRDGPVLIGISLNEPARFSISHDASGVIVVADRWAPAASFEPWGGASLAIHQAVDGATRSRVRRRQGRGWGPPFKENRILQTP